MRETLRCTDPSLVIFRVLVAKLEVLDLAKYWPYLAWVKVEISPRRSSNTAVLTALLPLQCELIDVESCITYSKRIRGPCNKGFPSLIAFRGRRKPKRYKLQV